MHYIMNDLFDVCAVCAHAWTAAHQSMGCARLGALEAPTIWMCAWCCQSKEKEFIKVNCVAAQMWLVFDECMTCRCQWKKSEEKAVPNERAPVRHSALELKWSGMIYRFLMPHTNPKRCDIMRRIRSRYLGILCSTCVRWGAERRLS